MKQLLTFYKNSSCIIRDLPKVTFLAEAEGRSRRSKTFGFWPKAEAEAEGIKIGIFLYRLKVMWGIYLLRNVWYFISESI